MTGNTNIDNTLFLQLLIKCPTNRLEKLFHHLIDAFCGQQSAVYDSYSDVWTLVEWLDLMHSSRTIFRTFRSSDEDLNLFTTLPLEFQNTIKSCLEVRNEDLRNVLIERSHAISPSYLKNFDWKLKLTMASDKVAQINEPRLLLDLDIAGNCDKSLLLDLSKTELQALINTMEKAKNALMDFLIKD